MYFKTTTLALLTAFFAGQSSAHSWVEQFSIIGDNGSYTGVHGYPRNYIVRNDQKMTILYPPNGQGRTRINSADMVCSPGQAKSNNNTADWPSLIALPGDYVAAKYLENGHVTRTETYVANSQIGKPGSGGLVYIYATTSTDNHKLMDVMTWGPNSTLAAGRLLAINTFDDGRCYQLSNSALGEERAVKFADPIPGQPGSDHELWCESNFQLPADAEPGNLAVYWVWQWPTLPGMDPGAMAGKDEIYTTCSDITIASNQAGVSKAVAGLTHPIQDPETEACSNYKVRAANTTFPVDKNFYGPGNIRGVATPSSSLANGGAAPATPSPAAAASSKAPNPAPAVQSPAAANNPSPVTVYVTVTATPSGACASASAKASSHSTVDIFLPFLNDPPHHHRHRNGTASASASASGAKATGAGIGIGAGAGSSSLVPSSSFAAAGGGAAITSSQLAVVTLTSFVDVTSTTTVPSTSTTAAAVMQRRHARDW